SRPVAVARVRMTRRKGAGKELDERLLRFQGFETDDVIPGSRHRSLRNIDAAKRSGLFAEAPDTSLSDVDAELVVQRMDPFQVLGAAEKPVRLVGPQSHLGIAGVREDRVAPGFEGQQIVRQQGAAAAGQSRGEAALPRSLGGEKGKSAAVTRDRSEERRVGKD